MTQSNALPSVTFQMKFNLLTILQLFIQLIDKFIQLLPVFTWKMKSVAIFNPNTQGARAYSLLIGSQQSKQRLETFHSEPVRHVLAEDERTHLLTQNKKLICKQHDTCNFAVASFQINILTVDTLSFSLIVDGNTRRLKPIV